MKRGLPSKTRKRLSAVKSLKSAQGAIRNFEARWLGANVDPKRRPGPARWVHGGHGFVPIARTSYFAEAEKLERKLEMASVPRGQILEIRSFAKKFAARKERFPTNAELKKVFPYLGEMP